MLADFKNLKAQPGNCEPNQCYNPNTEMCEACAEIPIDGGASLLLIAGGVYGVQRIRKMQIVKKQLK